ncbi:uncharacterized protein LOC122050797 [Zingiber officinale]|uniref:Calmodulin-binding protein n=1 Tax=Zingiber officinale TaxID=94328 RepID=A0A8J5HVY1_ZINOF|nr:uncharacterized protein LOC122050797 [Zingiber officinale]KAG6531365.1 hypothetical protein ZIOFF_005171 [Zingiber officinale]
MELGSPNNGESLDCSPARDRIGNSNSGPGPDAPGGYFFSCPASPVHYVLSSPPYSFSSDAAPSPTTVDDGWSAGPFEFDGAVSGGTMTSADELFLDGQIRPLRISSYLLRPQRLAPLLDGDEEEGEMTAEEEDGRWRGMRSRSRSLHRRTRSMSPLRSPRFQWQEEKMEKQEDANELEVLDKDPKEAVAETPPESEPSSRSSSTSSTSPGGRSSKSWIFLKDLLLHRSKSEGSGSDKDKFWRSISFSPSAKPKPQFPSSSASTPASVASSPAAAERIKPRCSKRPTNGVSTRRRPPAASLSPHERHYTVRRAQAEEMRHRTFLPYRPGLLSCLGFSSQSYSSAFDSLTKALNPVTSR